MTVINTKTEVVQQTIKGSNPGGPTDYPLGVCVPIVNFEWVKKFLELNGEGSE